MNCPGCSHSDWEYPDVAIARCKNCGYLLDPYAFGMKRDASPSNSRRSENSKRLAKIALLVSVILFVVPFWIPDWSGLWVVGAVASIFLFLDALMYG